MRDFGLYTVRTCALYQSRDPVRETARFKPGGETGRGAVECATCRTRTFSLGGFFMNRRSFLKNASIGATAAAATTLAAPAVRAQSATDMVIVSTWPRDFPGLGSSAQRPGRAHRRAFRRGVSPSSISPPASASAPSTASMKSPRATPRPISAPNITGRASIPPSPISPPCRSG